MKVKGILFVYILLGIIGIFTFSLFFVSNLDFIFNTYFANNDAHIKDIYLEFINYVVRGYSLENITFKYNDNGLSYMNTLRDFYFDLKLLMIASIGFFVMLSVYFIKDKKYCYDKIDNHTPFIYIGYLASVISLAVIIMMVVDNTTFVNTLNKLMFGSKYIFSERSNEIALIINDNHLITMSYIAVIFSMIISGGLIAYDYILLRKEREKMKIKLVAIDLDGTLLNDKKEVDERTKKAIENAKNKGVYVVLASGRPIRGMLSLIKELELDKYENYAINFNGGSINKTSDLSSIYSCSLTKKEMLEIEEFAKEHQVHSHAFVNGECYIEENGEYSDVEAKINSIPLHLTKYEDFEDDDVVNKYMFADDPNKLKVIYPLIPSSFFDKFTVVFSAPFFLEFLNKETNKGRAIEALCQYLNIKPEEVMAIGDEENDLSMLEYAGVKVAMGNANPKLKAIATFISDDNNSSGVAIAIEKYILLD